MIKNALYSLITMHPSIERLDVLCVGVAIIDAHQQWTIHILQDTKKFTSINREFKLDNLTQMRSSLGMLFDNCPNLQSARKLLTLNRSTIRLHDFEGVFCYENQSSFEDQVAAIMQESVLPVPIKNQPTNRRTSHKSRVRTKLQKQFKSMGILGKSVADITEHKVIPRYPISATHGLTAEFAIKNGVLNITETIEFDGTTDDALRNKTLHAQAKCLLMKTAIEMFGDSTERHVVVSKSNSTAKFDGLIDLLSSVAVIHDIENAADMDIYFESINRSAGRLH
jgi:hypothetical protein